MHATVTAQSDTHATLRACSLTCYAWHRPSRVVLYHSVVIKSTQAAAFLDHMKARTNLAELVHALMIFDKTRTAPAVISPWLLLLLPNIRVFSVHHALWFTKELRDDPAMDSDWFGWGEVPLFLPPERIGPCIRHHSSVHTLCLSGVTFKTGWDFLRFISSFTQLHFLTLGRIGLHALWDEYTSAKRLDKLLLCRQWPLSTIRYLQLNGSQVDVCLLPAQSHVEHIHVSDNRMGRS